ncbi:hypothetical protein ACC724_39960, partial [Rhizobium ruizarguesonis]
AEGFNVKTASFDPARFSGMAVNFMEVRKFNTNWACRLWKYRKPPERSGCFSFCYVGGACGCSALRAKEKPPEGPGGL